MLIDGVDFRVFNIDRNNEVIGMIKEKAITFYDKVLEYKETGDESLMPELDESKQCEESLDSFFEAKKGNYRKANDTETELMSVYKVLDSESKELDGKMRLIRSTLKDSLKENEYMIKDKLKCSWTKTKAGLRFQIRNLK